MKIVLILPRAGIYRYGTGAFSKYLRYSPMTLPTLAALVPKELNAQIELYDEGVEKVPKEKISADIVGITGITGASHRTYAYASYFRKKGMYIVVGGVHATLMTNEALQYADTLIIGHAYETWPQFLLDYVNGCAKKVYTPPSPTDFSKYRIPLRQFMKHKKFITINSVQAVFGCPNSCDFCVTPVVCKRYEMRPVEQVTDDIRDMHGKYFTFVDPSPTENVPYALSLYNAMIPLKKKWTSLSTTRLVHEPELMNAMEKSGCKGLLIGFESLSQKTNNTIKKPFNQVADYYRLVKELHKRGIAIMGCFVHGLDGDDRDSFKRTLDFVMETNIDLPRFTICTPFPGTPFFDRLKGDGRILTENWALYDAQHVVFKPAGMTVDELYHGHYWIWNEAYKTGNAIKRLATSKCFLRYTVLGNIGYKIYGKKLPEYSQSCMENDHLLDN